VLAECLVWDSDGNKYLGEDLILIATHLVVDVVSPGAAEEVFECAIVGGELVFSKLVVENHTSFAQLFLLV
jgi:hypothetical protein